MAAAATKKASSASKSRAGKKGGTAAKKTTTPRKARASEQTMAALDLIKEGRDLGLDIEAERVDLDALKATMATIKKAGIVPPMQLDEEQAERASMNPPAGLTGAALREYILTGKGTGEQIKDAREARAEQAREQRSAAAKERAGGPREGSGLYAAIKVMERARNPLTPDEIWERIKKDNLAPGMKGKTPAATIGAQLAVALKKGSIDGLERPQKGRYAIKKAGR